MTPPSAELAAAEAPPVARRRRQLRAVRGARRSVRAPARAPPVAGAALLARGAATPVRRLSLAVDPSAPAPLALHRHGDPIHPSPLHRVRSTTAPAGLYRLLAGWSFVRQHAPWALAWGALGDLPALPRVRLDAS
jgi:hypothetical protein